LRDTHSLVPGDEGIGAHADEDQRKETNNQACTNFCYHIVHNYIPKFTRPLTIT